MEFYSSIGFDGVRFHLEANRPDGTIVTARIPVGLHTDQDHDAAVLALRQAYTTLRQWSLDAAAANTDWPNKTAAQKDAAIRETIRRLGIFFDRFADLLITLNADA